MPRHTRTCLALALMSTLPGLALAQHSWDAYNPGIRSTSGVGVAATSSIEDTVRLRIAGDATAKGAHLLVAAGTTFDNGYVLAAASHAREKILGYNSKGLTANGLAAEVAWTNIADRVPRAFLSVRADHANDTSLFSTTSQQSAVTVETISEVTPLPYGWAHREGTRTTTVDTLTRTEKTFRGGTRRQLNAGLDFTLRATTEASVGVHQVWSKVPSLATQSSAHASLSVTEYLPSRDAVVTVGVSRKGRLVLAGQKSLDENWALNLSAYQDFRGSDRQKGIYAGLSHQWGSAPLRSPGLAAVSARDHLDARLQRMTTHSDGVKAVQAIGLVENEACNQQTTTVVESVTEWVSLPVD